MIFEPPAERPQTVGDLIGRGVRVYRRHLPLFFKTLLGPTIFSVAGALMLHWTISRGWSSASGHLSGMALCLGLLLCGLLILLLSKWVLTLRQLAFVRLSTGCAEDFASAYSVMRGRRWQVLALYAMEITLAVASTVILAGLLIFALMIAPKNGLLGGAAVIISAALATGGLVFSVGFILMSSFIIFSVTACEDGGINRVISRGLELISADFGRCCGFGLLVLVSMWMMSFPLSLPVVALTSSDLFQQGLVSERLSDTYSLPLYLLVIIQIWESLVNMLLWPAIYLSFGFFYYDLRLRQEGLDMMRTLDELETIH